MKKCNCPICKNVRKEITDRELADRLLEQIEDRDYVLMKLKNYIKHKSSCKGSGNCSCGLDKLLEIGK